jgi:hypothetical protein
MANEVLTHISQDQHERAKFRSRQKFLADMEHNLIVSRQEGIDEGIAIGEARGEARGEAIGRVEAARAMLSDGVPLEKVIKYTGLTDVDLKNLK